MPIRLKIMVIASLLLTQATAFPQELTPEQVAKLSLAEAPASITIITEEDIRRTPARNIYDLIEVYVPGATWMDYEDGVTFEVRFQATNPAPLPGGGTKWRTTAVEKAVAQQESH